MTDATSSQCQATTKAGARCKNQAGASSAYCHVHASKAAPTATSPATMAGDLNQVADQLRAQNPAYEPPAYSPQAMLALLQANLERVSAKVQIPVLTELKNNLKGTKPEDFMDPETWKGLWYVLNYTAQAQSRQALEKVDELLAGVPGGQALIDLRSGLEGASPKDLLDINTWKGAYLIADATVKAQITDLRRKVLGDDEK